VVDTTDSVTTAIALWQTCPRANGRTGESTCRSVPGGRDPSALSHTLQNVGHQRVGDDPFGGSLEVQQHAMAQGGERDGADIPEVDVQPTVHQRSDLRG
jgi:hypothetical protein